MPNPTAEIAGIDRTGKTACDSVSIRRSISDRSTMNCGLVERSGVYRPVVGNVIIIEQEQVVGSPGSAVRKFAGYIEDITEEHKPGKVGNIVYQLQCTDFTRMLDWKLYAGSFDAGVTFLSVITAIWLAKLSADGVTLAADIPSTPLPNRIQDGLRPLSEWFRKLATDTGYLYRIDEYKVLHFGPLATSPPNPAPFSLTFNSPNWRKLKIRKRLGDYRNVQYARTEYNISGVLTANFTGDGSTRDFSQIDGPFHGTPTVTLDGTPLVVGRFGFDSGNPAYDVFYDVEGWGIHWSVLDPAPGNGLAIVVQYRIRFNNTSVAYDSAEITARAAIQGDSGIIEAVNEDRYIDTKGALDARAANLLRQYGAVPTYIDFETDSRCEPNADDLDPGMQLAIDLTDGPSNVDDSFLVESIESEWKASAPSDVWIHHIQCTDQEPYGNRPQGGGGAGAVPIVLERLSEAVRIGPDISTVLTESPAPGTGAIIQMDITSNTTISAPTQIDDGGEVEYQLTQGGSPLGGWVVSWNAAFKGVNSSTVQQGDGLTTILRFRRIGNSYLLLFNSGEMEI